ncbi:UNVERIFIED_CONTAM: hypothetical protein Scaly_2784100 [Sesamum calycinum]|uniref:Uncharacterized protein n=1 Tax=Sesamum calycinum TaxID=2727403 RepID=A0AAW2IX07_9LAMI
MACGRAHRKKAEISPATEVATSKPVSGPVGFIDSAIEVVDLEPISSSVAPLPGKLSWINSIGSGMWLRGRTPRINWEEGRLIKAFDFRFRNNKISFITISRLVVVVVGIPTRPPECLLGSGQSQKPIGGLLSSEGSLWYSPNQRPGPGAFTSSLNPR